jgi:hypothetical protein
MRSSTSLAWCLYGAGMIMVLVAIPRSEPRQYDQERQRSGLRETVGTALSLALGVLLIAVGIVIQTRRS